MADEVTAAQTAKCDAEDTIFGKIIRGEIPCEFLHEDKEVIMEICIVTVSELVYNIIVCCIQ